MESTATDKLKGPKISKSLKPRKTWILRLVEKESLGNKIYGR
jgi:hypothetical protein